MHSHLLSTPSSLRTCPICSSLSPCHCSTHQLTPPLINVKTCNCQSNFTRTGNCQSNWNVPSQIVAIPQVLEESYVVRVNNERSCRKVVREAGGGKCLCNCGEVEREMEFWKSKVEEMEKIYELEVKSIKESIMSECRTILVILIYSFAFYFSQ